MLSRSLGADVRTPVPGRMSDVAGGRWVVTTKPAVQLEIGDRVMLAPGSGFHTIVEIGPDVDGIRLTFATMATASATLVAVVDRLATAVCGPPERQTG